MLRASLLLIAITLSFLLYSQTIFVKKEFCKKSEIELVAGTCIPQGYAIVGTSDLAKSEVGKTLESLTKKQLAQIRNKGKMFKSCKVFVDFNGVVNLTDKEGNNLNDKYLSIYALIPIHYCD